MTLILNVVVVVAEDWRTDGYKWVNGGNTVYSNRGRVIKQNVMKDGEWKVMTKFAFVYKDSKKRGFRLFEDDSKTLVQYFSADPKRPEVPHGNAKFNQRNYVRSAPSVLHNIREGKANGDGAKQTYSEMCTGIQPHLMHVLTPRDTEQVLNVRRRENQAKRIGKDEVINMYIAAHQLVDYVKCIELFPELVVVFGNESLLKEMASMIEVVGSDGKMYVGYDTTFNLGDFYVSIVTCRHFMFRSEPILPIMFMLHSRKFNEMHQRCWSVLLRALPQIKQYALPVLTDREKGIIDAIEMTSAGQNPLILCWNHIKRDVKRWLIDHNLSVHSTELSQQITRLLQAPNEHEFDSLVAIYRQEWPSKFADYFDKHLEIDMKLRAARWILVKYGVGNENGVTNNICESMNSLIKSFANRKEQFCDKFIVMMHRLQEGFLMSILRGFCGLGDLHLKARYQNHTRNPQNVSWPKCLSPDELVAQIKATEEGSSRTQEPLQPSTKDNSPASITIVPKSLQQRSKPQIDEVVQLTSVCETTNKPSMPDLSQTPDQKLCAPNITSPSLGGQTQMAQHVLAMDGITRVPGKPLYAVKSLHGVHYHLVQMEPKVKCSCEAKNACYHIIATKLFLGLHTATPMKEHRLSHLAKQFTGKREGRAGRKRARKGDYDYEASLTAEEQENPDKKRKIESDLACSESDEEAILDGIEVMGESEEEDPSTSSQSSEESSAEWWLEHLSLTLEDKSILLTEGKWLLDKHIEAAMKILKEQFPHLKGFDPPYWEPKKDKGGKWHYLKRFPQVTSNAVQIHYNGINHWVTSFQSEGKVFFLDSGRSWGSKKSCINDSLSLQLSAMYATQGKTLEICIPDIMKQLEGNCGVHAIANAVYVCFNARCPSNVTFRKGMRQHLVACLERGSFTEFRFSQNSEKLSSTASYISHSLDINCPCRLPDFFDDMIECNSCKLWVHSRCQDISDIHQIEQRAKFFCNACKIKTPHQPVPRLLKH